MAGPPDPLPKGVTDAAAAWFARRDVGALSPTEETALEAWLAADPAHRRAWAALHGLWGRLETTPRDSQDAIRANVERWQVRRRRRKRMALGGVAACLIAVVTFQGGNLAIRLQADVITATGERRDIRLEDGSVLHLNSGSAVAIDYSSARRKIRLLAGEVAFEVASAPTRPFVVDAVGGSVTALGTRFIVRADGVQAQVTVTEHSVGVRSAAGTKVQVVREGQGVRFGAGGVGRSFVADIWAATGWMRGKLVFENRPLGEVVAEIGRYHPGMIRVIDDAAARKRVSGVFPLDDPVAAIDDVERSFGLRSIRLTDRLILIRK
ncbi:MAG: FecR family protein [Sphingobium sp.]